MATLFAPPVWTPVDGSGNTYPGALAYFYRTGTSTPQDTYSDSGATTPNANPVVADANGRFSPIYLSADYDYKLVLKTSGGTTLATVDPVPLSSFQTTVILNGSTLSVMPFATPQGRLTLQTAEAVMAANYTAKTTLYYTPYIGNLIPLWDGTNMVPTTFAELSNLLTESSTGKAGPAAAGPYQNIDAFVWSDGGTVRLTRGPKWSKSSTAAITIATPGVVTWVSHGLYDGATVRFTTTGALPTGLSASTDYFVTKVDADTFKLSTSIANQIAGTFIATSGSQSGTHTVYNFTTARGTGTGTTELEQVNGIWVNKYDITNGPLARKGTYVGTIYCDSASQANWHTGAVAANGTEAKLHVWNAYNRVPVEGLIGDSTDSWTYSTATARPANNSGTMRVTFLQGLQGDSFYGHYACPWANDTTSRAGVAGIGYDSTSAFSGRKAKFSTASSTAVNDFRVSWGDYSVQAFGLNYMQALELPENTTHTWYGDNGGAAQNGLAYRGRF